MSKKDDFELKGFMPYLLNMAADMTSRSFEAAYKAKYGMLRTEWRVVFHLGRYGSITAKEICERSRIHKTKVSRAVHALEEKRYLTREQMADDRRHARLSLTKSGTLVFEDLIEEARAFDEDLLSGFSEAERAQMRQFLIKLAEL